MYTHYINSQADENFRTKMQKKKKVRKPVKTEYINFCAVYFFHPVVVVATQPLPRHGGMAEDDGAPEAWQLPRTWTRGRRETESRQ